MLYFVVWKRRRTMELKLMPPGPPEPRLELWTQLDEPTRQALLEQLATMIVRAATARPAAEDEHDD